jgi:hypothetical protein
VTIKTSERMVTNERSSKFFGSTTAQFYVGEDFKLIRHAQIIAMRRQSIRDDTLAHLFLGKGVDHVVFERILTDPAVFNMSSSELRIGQFCNCAVETQ